jgi:hypothetical protein
MRDVWVDTGGIDMTEDKLAQAFARWIIKIMFWVMLMGINLVWAFPVKWCWNYVVPHLWGWPELTWGQAWCFMFLVAQVKMVFLWCDHQK